MTVTGTVQDAFVPWVAGLTLAQAVATANFTGADEPQQIILTRQGERAALDAQVLLWPARRCRWSRAMRLNCAEPPFFFNKLFSEIFRVGQPLSYLPCESGVVIETKIMTTNEQLELGFNGTQHRIFGRPRPRVTRAQWWFAKMREAVENAVNWQNETPSRPEQIWMPGANREVKI